MGDIQETICALSTAPGRAGIAVIRISGAASFSLSTSIFTAEDAQAGVTPRRATLGKLVDPRTGTILDQVLVTQYPAPNSYTGEDVCEISLHGSPVLVAAALETLCALGARLAEPGEFTLRAFLHGRIDLAQAEAVRDIIDATTVYQAQVAARQREGELSQQIKAIEHELVDVIVQLETVVEFAESDDLTPATRASIGKKLERVQDQLTGWIQSYRRGRIVHDGFSLAIVGRPNVGKSSLFNALLRQERSIVTEVPGTTRDMVSELTSLDGIPVRLLDTAGVRASEDMVERLGVERSLRAMADADIILLVTDISEPPASEDEELCRKLAGLSCIVVFNKSDLAGKWPAVRKSRFGEGCPRLEVSARTGKNLEALRVEIQALLFGETECGRDGVLITSLRHCRCLESAAENMSRGIGALHSGLSEEFVLADLHAALRELGTIIGETSKEDLLDEIFSQFCIGK